MQEKQETLVQSLGWVKKDPWRRLVQSLGWVKKNPWRRKWQPTPVFLPRKFQGQRRLVSYRPWGCKELNTTEQLSIHVMI